MRAAVLLCACLALPVTTGCHRPPPPAPAGKLPELPPPPEQEIVATVDGHPISVADVTTQARASGKDPQQALQELIDAELLAREAERRGLVSDPAVQRARDTEMVRRFLQEDFERNYTADNSITGDLIRRAYERSRGRLVHPLLKEVSHIVVLTPKARPEAEQLADEVHRRALKVKTEDEFKHIATDLEAAGKQIGLTVRAEHLVTNRKGTTVEEFAKAAYDLQKPGDISPVVRTSFGYHVIWLSQNIQEENITLEQVEPKIRKDLWPEVRKRIFARYQDELAKQHQVATYPERLAQLPANE